MRVTKAGCQRAGSCLSLAVALWLSSAVAFAGSGVWTTGGPYGGSINALAIDPASPATLYAGTVNYGGVFKSTNSGRHLDRRQHGPGKRVGPVLGIDPTSPATVYAVTYGGVYKTTNSGGTWSSANTGLPMNQNDTALVIDPTSPATLYLATFGVYKSTNSAAPGPQPSQVWDPGTSKRWPSIPRPRHALRWNVHIRHLQVHRLRRHLGRREHGPDGLGRLRPGHRSGVPRHAVRRHVRRWVFKSVNSGGTWAAANTGLPTNQWVITLAIDPVSPATLYAGTVGGGIFKSTNSGGTWAPPTRARGTRTSSPWPSIPRRPPRSTPARPAAGSSSPPTPVAPGPPSTRA